MNQFPEIPTDLKEIFHKAFNNQEGDVVKAVKALQEYGCEPVRIIMVLMAELHLPLSEASMMYQSAIAAIYPKS